MPLTDTAIRGSKPATRPFKIYYRDGLFLLINPSGSKLWRWRYRADGKEKLMALGEYPVVGLAEVRERHLAARKKLANGIDPMDERKSDAATKQENTKALLRQAESSFEKKVFPGANDKDKTMSNNTILFALYRLGYKGG